MSFPPSNDYNFTANFVPVITVSASFVLISMSSNIIFIYLPLKLTEN